MPPQSAAERNRMKAFVQQTSNRLSGSPQKNRRGDQSPDAAFTDNLESLNIIQANHQHAKAQDDLFDENTRPPSAQSVDGRSARDDRLFNGSELPEGFMRSGRSTPTSEIMKQSGDRKRRRKSLDYDDQALNTMEYRALLEQPFDFDPATATASGNTIGRNGDGDQRLAQMRHTGSAEQQRFFGDMSVDEWETAGNWLSEQFTGIMRKLTAARQSKRHIVDSFEQEAAAREAEVRRRSNKIDEKLQKMREDGMKVVGGRSC
ncbi:hypothetical protein LEL_00919 [Akanthomyces lecanii RCEF 1005]|uniref:Extracellular mutant protein 11 C-terminal domain-containing protein n=1 Tax=Akanthomyces lecanii RCEF 1005 TaxID=1081108 RepID=A0A168K8X5_CORDF|nr:hypothetical protein LEL_00919 [Akanthomyces lecanii RCEF 1005]